MTVVVVVISIIKTKLKLKLLKSYHILKVKSIVSIFKTKSGNIPKFVMIIDIEVMKIVSTCLI